MCVGVVAGGDVAGMRGGYRVCGLAFWLGVDEGSDGEGVVVVVVVVVVVFREGF